MQRKKVSKLPLIIGVVLIAAAGLGVISIINGIRNDVNVVTAATDLPAYSYIDADDVEIVPIPSAAVSEHYLTEEEFKEKYKESIVVSAPVLAGQTIDSRYIPKEENASFAVVLPDERIVAVTSSVAGAAIGTVQAGDVVTASTSSSPLTGNPVTSEYAKVLCITSSPAGCQGILPPTVSVNTASLDDEDAGGGTNDRVIALLAVPALDASELAGASEATLTLDPFCRVDADGYLFSPRADQGEDFLCQAPNTRLASQKAKNEDSSDADFEDDNLEAAE